ncbi:hypothetical protein ACF0H5_017553 [Mactra antiquata]
MIVAKSFQVNENHGLSPGKTTAIVQNERDKKRSHHILVESSTDGKKRRLQLNLNEKSTTSFHETLAGNTYKSGIHTFKSVSDNDSETKEIPTPVLCPGPPTIGAQIGSAIVLFDLETTGLAYSSDILQIAAVDISSDKKFSAYVKPKIGFIPEKVRRLTDLELRGSEMYHHGLPVQSVPINDALNDFVNFLRPLEPVTLVAHNVLFDAKIIMYNAMTHGLNDICNIINGFGDTLQLFRAEFVDRRERKLSFAQDKLAKDILGVTYQAHDALEDVRILKRLVLSVENISEKLPVYNVNNIKDRLTRIVNERKFNSSYESAVAQQVLTISKSKQLASAGLNFDHLKTIYVKSGESGINDILKVIMKSSNKVSAALCKYMDNIKENICIDKN